MCKENRPEILLLVIWSIVMIFATFMQRRFGYYSSVNLCLLTAYLCWLILNKYSLRKHSKKQVKKHKLPEFYYSKSIATVLIFVFAMTLFLPNAILSRNQASCQPYAITRAWAETVEWIKDNTPEPFDTYYDTFGTFQALYLHVRMKISASPSS